MDNPAPASSFLALKPGKIEQPIRLIICVPGFLSEWREQAGGRALAVEDGAPLRRLQRRHQGVRRYARALLAAISFSFRIRLVLLHKISIATVGV